MPEMSFSLMIALRRGEKKGYDLETAVIDLYYGLCRAIEILDEEVKKDSPEALFKEDTEVPDDVLASLLSAENDFLIPLLIRMNETPATLMERIYDYVSESYNYDESYVMEQLNRYHQSQAQTAQTKEDGLGDLDEHPF